MDSNELPVLAYKDGENSVAPIPAHEQQLPTVTAEPWLEISKQGLQLEGLCFDRQGNLLLCEVFGGTIFHVNLSDKKVTELFKSHKQNPAAVKIHKDGRLFVCYLGDFESTGGIFMVDADGNDAQDIV